MMPSLRRSPDRGRRSPPKGRSRNSPPNRRRARSRRRSSVSPPRKRTARDLPRRPPPTKRKTSSSSTSRSSSTSSGASSSSGSSSSSRSTSPSPPKRRTEMSKDEVKSSLPAKKSEAVTTTSATSLVTSHTVSVDTTAWSSHAEVIETKDKDRKKSAKSVSEKPKEERVAELKKEKTPPNRNENESARIEKNIEEKVQHYGARGAVSEPKIEEAPSPPSVERPFSRQIFIKKLTRNVNREHLQEIFGIWGEIESIEFPEDEYHPEFGKGFAYVHYKSRESLERAVSHMNGGQIDGQNVTVLEVKEIPRGDQDRYRNDRRRPSRERRLSPIRPARRSDSFRGQLSQPRPVHRSSHNRRRVSPFRRRRSPCSPRRASARNRRSLSPRRPPAAARRRRFASKSGSSNSRSSSSAASEGGKNIQKNNSNNNNGNKVEKVEKPL